MSNLNSAPELVKGLTSFADAKKVTRGLYLKGFVSTKEEGRSSFPKELSNWANTRLHSRAVEDRIAALTALAFYLNFVTNENELSNMVTQLERILPTENRVVIEGAAYMFEHIARRITTPFLPRIFERCASWISTRPTLHAVLSSVLLMKRLFFSDATNQVKSLNHLISVIYAAIKFDNVEIQKMAVELNIMRFERDPAVDESVRTTFADLIMNLQTNSSLEANRALIVGTLFLLEALAKEHRRITLSKFDQFFPPVLRLFEKGSFYNMIEYIPFFCENFKQQSDNYVDEILKIYQNIAPENACTEICKSLARMIRVYPDKFAEFGFEYAKKLEPNNIDGFSIITTAVIIVKPEVIDQKLTLDVIFNSPISEHLINLCKPFFDTFPFYIFRAISKINNKIISGLISDDESCINALKLLERYASVDVFDPDIFYPKILNLSESPNEQIRLQAVISAYKIIGKMEDKQKQRDALVNILFVGQSDSSKIVRMTIMQKFPDCLLSVFSDASIVSLVEVFIDDESTMVRLAALDLVGRIKSEFPLNVLNLFWSRLTHFDVDFFHTEPIVERKKQMRTFPYLVKYADEFVVPLLKDIIHFITVVLNNDPPSHQSLADRMNQHQDEKFDRMIRLAACGAAQVLGTKLAQVPECIKSLVESVVRQLFLNHHPSFHIEIVKTLHQIFRSVDVIHKTDVDIMALHQALFKFIRMSTNSSVMYAFVSLFGTIGPLDPFIFHASELKMNPPAFDAAALCDRTKREKSYLDFVMNYIVGQLQSGRKTHDPNALVNAIVYIFQSDSKGCSQYLEVVIKIFVNLFHDTNVISDSLFSFLRSIVLLVDVGILPYAGDVMNVIEPHLSGTPSPSALKLLAALVFSLKSEFKQFGAKTFKMVINALSDKRVAMPETRLYLLLTMTLLTIFADGCTHEFLAHITAATNEPSLTAGYALTFLAQAIAAGGMHHLVLPALKLALKCVKRTDIKAQSLQVLYVLTAKYPEIVLQMPVGLEGLDNNLDIVIETTKREGKADLSKFDFVKNLAPAPDPFGIRTKNSFEMSSVKNIFAHGRLHTVSETNWAAWSLQFVHELTLCSPSPAIRACIPLYSSSSQLHVNIFPLLFLSVWEVIDDECRQLLAQYLEGIVSMQDVPMSVLRLVAAACEVLDRAGYTLFEDNMWLDALTAERCNSWFQALRFFEKRKLTDVSTEHLLKITTQLKRKESALGIRAVATQAHSNCQLLESLSMWPEAREIYKTKLEENERAEKYLEGYLSCSSKLDDWEVIAERFNDFESYSKPLKSTLGPVFAGAAISMGYDETKFLEAVIEDTPISCYWRAIAAVKRGDDNEAETWIKRGKRTLVRETAVFSSGNYEPTIPVVSNALLFEELYDVVSVMRGKQPEDILKLWSYKLDSVVHEPNWLRLVYRSRVLLKCDEEERLQMHIYFFNRLRKLHDWIHFDLLAPNLLPSDDPRVKLLKAKATYDRGMVTDLHEFEELIASLKASNSDQETFCSAVCSYASRTPDRVKALELLSDVVAIQPSNVRAYKYFAYFNLALSEQIPEKAIIYANSAIGAFIKLTALKTPMMHHLCQLCSIFFSYAIQLQDFKAASDALKNLDNRSVSMIMPQLLIQVQHPSAPVRKVVFSIIERYAEKDYQSLAFSLALVSRLNPPSGLATLINKIESKNLQISTDVHSLSSSLIYTAVLPIEILIDEFTVLRDRLQENQVHEAVESCKRILQIKKEHERFLQGQKMATGIIYDKIAKFIMSADEIDLSKFAPSVKTQIAFMRNKLETIETVDVNELEIPLATQKKFAVSVPGLEHEGNEPYVTIERVNHVLKTIPSAMKPRKLSLTGSDGRNYKYLLKGGVDLRIDQHVMQLFSLVNGIFREDKFGDSMRLSIYKYGITPLSPNAGLISWADGTKTIYSMIFNYRRLRHTPLDVEQRVYEEFLGRNNYKELAHTTTKIQRLELFNALRNAAPDDQLREDLWLKSPSAESWLTQSTNFSRSTATMSMVGHIIGLGDRHPTNILVNQKTGMVVHIDLSDCFEKAARRKYFPETVPFRLTRMITAALGPAGVSGIFSQTAVYVMTLLKRNKGTILAFLDIFVKQPVIDMVWYSPPSCDDNDDSEVSRRDLSLKMAMQRVDSKLSLTDLSQPGEPPSKTVEKHVKKLVKVATNDYNLSQMYFGWSPYW